MFAAPLSQELQAALVQAWLEGGELTASETFLARAAATPVLMVVPVPAPGERTRAACPRCAGPPQLSYLGLASEALCVLAGRKGDDHRLVRGKAGCRRRGRT